MAQKERKATDWVKEENGKLSRMRTSEGLDSRRGMQLAVTNGCGFAEVTTPCQW